ncbi:helix-turn-helix domain-containing protein [Streptomyces sp. NPDC006923]|uniref:helix-turn-helix domain-containing protein n=1 Tax=Streptomyces sp. NPDC006923 TaxID=3155355 RepID=UPI003410D3CB
MHALAAHLMRADHQGQPLSVLLGCASRLAHEVSCYVGAVVREALERGDNWSSVATAAGTGEDTARSLWSRGAVSRLLAQYAPVPEPRAAPEDAAPRQLGAALAFLQQRSGMTVAEAAAHTGLRPADLLNVFAGEQVPPWPAVHMLAVLFGDRPGDLEALWLSAQSTADSTRPHIGTAAERLCAALRGLHLAASSPDATRISRSAGLAPELITAVLDGDHIPDWPTACRLAVGLGADPAGIRHLWEDVHYAFLTSADAFPPSGLPRTRPPDPHHTPTPRSATTGPEK